MKDIYGREWITKNALSILSQYSGGITVRQLHYRLVSIGMINDVQHYKRVVDAMGAARWDGLVDMSAFIDRERSMYGRTEADAKTLEDEIERGKDQISAWMRAYNLNRWSNQENYIEVWIEKKALQGVFERPCLMKSVGLAPCKGYPSITFLYDASVRFDEAISRGKRGVILYFGDFDPSGEDIPRSIAENLGRMGTDVEVIRRALNQEQITRLGLPGVPAKASDSRTASWDGAGCVELDAVDPHLLGDMCNEAIDEFFNDDLYNELKQKEREERARYRESLREYVRDMDVDEEAD